MTLPTLLLLPGLLCDATAWQHQITHLSNLTKIVVPDLTSAKSPQEMVAAALAVAPPSFMLAGHSMGGWVALEIMRVAPTRVTKLCLANTTAKLDSADKSAARRQMIQQAEQGQFNDPLDKLAAAFVYNKTYLAPVRAMLARNQSAFINQERAMLAREDCVPVLASIGCPTLVIHSNQDAVFDITDSQQLSRCIHHAKLEIIDQSGHMSIMEQAATVTALMQAWCTSTAI